MGLKPYVFLNSPYHDYIKEKSNKEVSIPMTPWRRQRDLFPGFCIFPGYKWCGPGCSGPGFPINEVDAACKAHDECYRRFGPSCYCDQEFMHRLRHQINPYTTKGRHAQLLYNYMNFKTLFACSFTRKK